MSKYVDLSERVTASYYDEEHEEWTQKTVTVADVLDSVCDDYTVLPSIDAVQIVRCNDCKHYKQSDVADRKMCCRKDVDGMPVCYDFLPDDWCKYGERKEDE